MYNINDNINNNTKRCAKQASNIYMNIDTSEISDGQKNTNMYGHGPGHCGARINTSCHNCKRYIPPQQIVICNKCNNSTPTTNNNSLQLELTDQFKPLINETTGAYVIIAQRAGNPCKIFNIAKSYPSDEPSINYLLSVGETSECKLELRWNDKIEIRLTNNVASGIYNIKWL
jgi:hypothetical protein